MKLLVVIPARKGSKGIPGKNKKLLNGKPLIQYSIEAALQTVGKKQICVTTDDEDIITLSENLGVKPKFKRSKELSSDTANSRDVILDAIEKYKEGDFDHVLLLQPTSPFRTANHIKRALEQYEQNMLNLDMLVGVKESSTNPYYNLFEENNEGFLEKSKTSTITRRQDLPPVYEYNGAIYIFSVKTIQSKNFNNMEKILKFEMDEISSFDIDTKLDWLIAETIATNIDEYLKSL